jgi:adenosylmethionine-8-amino-7-oxononanoate aminotransferase
MTTPDVIVVGTDTDAGKTTFSLHWLRAFPVYEYWKPVETGESDTQRMRAIGARVHQPLMHLQEAVAPALAARRAGVRVPTVEQILAARPAGPLLIESFGSALSPLDEDTLQVAWLQRAPGAFILVSSASVGAVGRVLQSLVALASYGITPRATVLIGPRDAYAMEQIGKRVAVFSLPSLPLPPAGEELELHALAAALVPPAPNANLVARDKKSVWHPYTSLQAPDAPLPVREAYGEFLLLDDGREIIDGISSWWTILHGHRHPVLMNALREASARYDHFMFAGLTHEPAIALAENLLQSLRMPGGRVFYSDNGSTAVEVALKMAYQYWCQRGQPERRRFIGFAGGYHGDTFGAMAVSRDPVFFGRFEKLLFAADIVEVNAAALAEKIGPDVAAVILEPLVQGAGGMRMHGPETLAAIAQVCADHDIPLILDEVMTGGGRVGPRWAHQRCAGLAPDLVCAGKTITGGAMPLAATMASARIVAAFDSPHSTQTFFHGHSFTAHPLACAVAVANQSLETVSQVARIENFWRQRFPHARVCGSIVAMDVDAPGGYLADIARAMRHAALAQGVLLRPLGNVLYAMPPLETSDASLARIAQAIEASLAAAGIR